MAYSGLAGLCAPWTPIWACPLPTGSAAVSGDALAAATEVLWTRSGQRFGLCSLTVRPCRRDCWGQSWPGSSWWEWTGGAWPQPALIGGAWFNLACGSCPGSCSCTALEEAILPGPVNTVTEVKVDGIVLAASAYRLDEHRLLTRVDGGTWPTCQDLAAPDTADNTWSVTATFGTPVPTLGQMAVGELAAEFVKILLCDESCRLPQPVQQLVRQGITMSFLDPNALFDAGRIGLYTCDLFLGTTNPHGLPGLPQVYDVDGPNFRTTGS